MILEKIQITSFGKLEHFEAELAPGINIFEGANESGKSTIASFIKFIFYGSAPKERALLVGWQSSGAAGSITFSDEDRRYRLERVIAGTREAVQLIDAATNMPIRGALDGKTPGEFFFGVDAEMFSATAFVSQLGAAPKGAKISDGIQNILFSADENVNTQRALSKLDAARASLLHKNEKGGRLYEMDAECAELETRLDAAMDAHKTILTGEAQLADMNANLAEVEEKAKTAGAKVSQFEAVTLLGLFDRDRAIEKRMGDLKAAIEQAGAPDPDLVNEIGARMENFEVLRRSCEDAKAHRDENPVPQMSADLKEYMEVGGRETLENELHSAKASAKSFTLVGIVLFVLGLAALVLMAVLGYHVALLVAGAVLSALAVTLLILGGRARGKASEIASSFDFDAMDKESEAYQKANESAKLYALALADAEKRLESARTELQKFGVEPEKLAEYYASLKQKMRDVEGLKAEYDKFSTLHSHMREQLAPYHEDELKARLDPDVDISDVNAENLPVLRRDAEVAERMAASLAKHRAELEKTLAGLYPTAEDPTKLTDKYAALKMERDTLLKRHAAYKLACEKLAEAGEHLRESVAPRLAQDAAMILSEITSGKYQSLGVGTELEMTADTESGQRSLAILSAGTQDAAYLSLRLALVKLLYRKMMPPMIFDEAFVRQDDARLTKLLRMLHRQQMQCILFTSNSRDADTMNTIGDFHHIQMP